jgi:arylsulfatase
MAIHAAMVDRMDQEIGRLLEQLRAMNAFDNTLIFFLSDNGASAEIMVRDDGHDRSAPPGSAATHLCLGPGWSTVSNTPHRRHKTWVHEGGISTPLVVHWPAGIKVHGEIRQTPGHVIDIVPTILEAVGAQRPDAWEGTTLPPLAGKSLRPVFAEDGEVPRDCLWWLHEGNRAIRVADWKLVAAKDAPWQLFDLGADRSESDNLIDRYPEKARELEQLWQARFDDFCRLAREP